jgi:hypothetical protein
MPVLLHELLQRFDSLRTVRSGHGLLAVRVGRRRTAKRAESLPFRKPGAASEARGLGTAEAGSRASIDRPGGWRHNVTAALASPPAAGSLTPRSRISGARASPTVLLNRPDRETDEGSTRGEKNAPHPAQVL